MSLIERAAARALEDQQSAIDDDGATTAESDTSLNMTSGLPSNTEPVSLSEKHLQKQGCLTRGDNVSPLAQEYRRIKRPLLFNLRSKIQEQGHPSGANLIMITSAMPGEGKSFVSVNLALSIAAEIDQTVLLIDTDVTKRGAAAILGIDRLPGLLDVVVGEQSVEDVLIKTDISNFSFMPAGTSRSNADELFASEAMRDLILEMGTRYSDRVLIFDTPPVFATNVPSILVKMMGQLAFVVEADNSPQELVEDALNRLEGCETIGLILNKASRRMPGHRYEIGYGYT